MIHESNNRKDLWQSGTYDEISIEFQCRDPQNDIVSSNNNDNNIIMMYATIIYLWVTCVLMIIINVANYNDMLGVSNTGSFKSIIFILLNYCLQIINSSFSYINY